jgi:hypothetical protein
MANTFLNPDLIARQAYANLYEQTHMARLVWRDYEADFAGKQGDTVTIRRPAVFEADEFNRSAGIQIQAATQSGIPVKLDTLLDVSFEVTTEQLTLEIEDFNEALLSPATEAIVQGIDRKLLTLRADVTNAVTYPTGDDARPATSLVDASKALNDANVPPTMRHAVFDTLGTAALLKDPLFHSAEQRGDTEGLREASIGRKFGFDNWMSQNITDGESVAFHRTAFALVARTLALPRGASNAAVFGGRGFGIRVVMDYDIDKKQDVVSLDVLIGVKTLDAARATLMVPTGLASS